MNYKLCAIVIAVLSICVLGTQAAVVACTEPNTVFNSCPNNCSDQCPTFPPQACTFDCREGCYCVDNYKRAPNQTCVPITECPGCPENEILSDCTGLCTNNCPGVGPDACTAVCSSGCTCKPNYKRDETGKCIPEEECIVECPENSAYRCVCDDSCQKDLIDCFTCNYRCGCNSGFSRIDDNCVPDKQCPAETPIAYE